MREGDRPVELGIYSFGDVPRDPDTGALGTSAQAQRNLLEAIRVADEVGLDYAGVGEHHTREMPASAGATLLAGAATVTSRIRLGSSVTVLSTDDPVRVFQQFATVDALSGGRAEVTAGRGSSTESFPLFGHSLADYDELYEEKLALLLRLNDLDEGEAVSWQGRHRSPITDAVIVPRPWRARLPIWRGTGGSPESSERAGRQGLPLVYGIIGGRPARFAPLVRHYRAAGHDAGHAEDRLRVGVATLGFVHPDRQRARDLWWPRYRAGMAPIARVRGFAVPERDWYDAQTTPDGAFFVGDPEEVAEKILRLHNRLGHDRHILQMDLGGLDHHEYLRAIELLGTEVKPRVDAELARTSATHHSGGSSSGADRTAGGGTAGGGTAG